MSNNALIDSHCHFDFSAFDPDREALWSEAKLRGVRALLIPGYEPEQWSRAEFLCRNQPDWHFSVGLHPWAIGDYLSVRGAEALEKALLAALNTHSEYFIPALAVGECGLDAMQALNIETQISILKLHIDVANAHRKPLILHCVKAHNAMLQTLKLCPPKYGAVLHAFSGSYELAMQYWRRGVRLGVGGVITYSRAKRSRDSFSRLPLEALLLETDAPSMPLNGRQGERNRPEYLYEICQCLVSLRSESFDEIAQKTCENFYDLFSIARSK